MTHRFTALAFGLLALPLLAQQPDKALPEVKVKAKKGPKKPDPKKAYQAPVATTAAKVDAPLNDIPQTVNVVTGALLQDQGAKSMQDALRTVAGVGLSSGDGQRDQVSIRGFSAIGDQFVDGLRDDAMYFRDLSNVAQVEVLKGPASVLYGRGSSGGVINRVTKKADGAHHGELALIGGSFDLKRAVLDFGDAATETVSYRATAAVERSGGFRNQAFLEREAATPSVLFRFGKDTRMGVQFDHLRDKRTTDFGVPSLDGRPVDVPRETYYGSPDARKDDFTESTMDAGLLRFEHGFSRTLELRNVFRIYDFELDRRNTMPGQVLAATRQVRLNHGEVARKERGWFNQLELVQRASTGPVFHEVLYGMELGRQRKYGSFATFTNVATVDLFNPVLRPLNLGTPSVTENATNLITTAFYAQDLITFSDHWKALLGLRHDRYRQETDVRRPTSGQLERTDAAWSPRAGVVFQPDTVQSWYLSYSRSFQPSGELSQLSANNANIEPEQTRNLEAGLKLDLIEGRATATFSVFDLERTGIKSSDPANPALLVPIGTQRTRGLEAGFDGQVGSAWRLHAGYAYLDARLTKSTPGTKVAGVQVEGHRPSLTPVNSGNLWADWAFAQGWSAGLGVNASGDRFASASNLVRLGSYVTFDGALRYRTRTWDLDLNLYNLTNRKYIQSGHGGSDILLLPGGPLTAQVTARFHF
jgi:catecholate siderophore receptor